MKLETEINHRGALVSIMAGTFMAALDTSIVNIAVPELMTYFQAPLPTIKLIVSVYMIGLVMIMPLSSWLKDHFGLYRLYLYGLIVFLLGTLLCSISGNFNLLVVARGIQAIGGGVITPTTMAIIASIYAPKERARILGLWGLGVVIGPAFGPTIGGIITQHFGWRGIFLLNIPLGLLGLLLAKKYLSPIDRNHVRNSTKFDFKGLFVFIASVICFFSFLNQLSNVSDFISFKTLILLAFAIVSLIAFVKIENSQLHPMVNLKLFSNSSFRACILVTFFRSMALYGGMLLLPVLLTVVMGYSETKAGMYLFPGTAFVAAFMPLAGRLAHSIGPRLVSQVGLVLLAASMFWFSRIEHSTAPWEIIFAMSLRGIALGLLVTPVTLALMSSVSTKEVTMASSINSLGQQLGGALGVTLFALLQQGLNSSAEKVVSGSLNAMEYSMRGTFMIASGIVMLALLAGKNLARYLLHDS